MWIRIRYALAALLAMTGGVMFSGCGGPFLTARCTNSPIREVVSPDGQRKAVVFTRDCGATTGVSTHVSVVGGTNAVGAEAGNTFVADTDRGRSLPGPGGGPNVYVTWADSGSLEISYDAMARTFRQEAVVAGVVVTYRRLKPASATNK